MNKKITIKQSGDLHEVVKVKNGESLRVLDPEKDGSVFKRNTFNIAKGDVFENNVSDTQHEIMQVLNGSVLFGENKELAVNCSKGSTMEIPCGTSFYLEGLSDDTKLDCVYIKVVQG